MQCGRRRMCRFCERAHFLMLYVCRSVRLFRQPASNRTGLGKTAKVQ